MIVSTHGILKPLVSFVNAYSVDFGGGDEYLSVTHNAIFNFGTGAFTISAWIKTSTTGAAQWVYHKYVLTNEQLLAVGSDNKIWFRVNAVTALKSITSVTDGVWHHIAGVRTAGGDMSIYLDGVDNTSGSMNDANDVTSASDINIGRHVATGNYFVGNIDEISVWNAAITTGLISGGKPPDLSLHASYANLAETWRMGDGATYPNIPGAKNSNTAVMQNMESGDIVAVVP